ncbi:MULTISPECIES: amino acid ABC transporter ATP-binding protein [Variovorax]|jgi:ABC-type polar amino acid transport system ATPase subunit|uniref:amino acid ABC transporter ATP-binding protein n=1 Tax=Variovorax TaxID=34072 RepID=UPI00086DCF09|nr:MULTISPECIES: amino acid ABC transporter ATP-binding protein [Variovorax]MBN8751921.1 amino acid ABC transporter ATP-binding protein [Variovorax sp.]ODU17735.1 MAG: amino acid ABC transporter ATP-binding protein [Variovorax sp. SCN 67-85]ODV27092.1 MAG: amino acid ABC transporter ATP-binding protein [Variovorax sp. SCN 67-20]OJZ09254.1 MAG: amino acid ABC transporter ATP-binding protein [Variovorax sp. 67-131]UKI11730.1 amino acid ABC transporter ATP-binding protein [Variovorax paradoxus]
MSLVLIESVEKHFGDNHVLRGVSTEVAKGDIVALVGRSGSGKSTLLRCVNGLETISAGRIVVDGVDVQSPDTDLALLRRRVGMVFQSFNLFPHLSAAANVTLAPVLTRKIAKGEARDLAKRMLERVGLGHKLDAMPSQLSGGQQQRVAIARALAMSPQLMLFDEATSALDPELVGEVLRVMEDLARDGMTMMVVTHEMAFARRVASEVLFMNQGRIWERGTPERMFGSPQTPEFQQFVQSVV